MNNVWFFFMQGYIQSLKKQMVIVKTFFVLNVQENTLYDMADIHTAMHRKKLETRARAAY